MSIRLQILCLSCALFAALAPASLGQTDARSPLDPIGTRFEGENFLVTVEASGEDTDEAREQAEARARALALSSRATRVRSAVDIDERVTSDPTDDNEYEYSSATSSRTEGTLFDARVVRAVPLVVEGRAACRLTLSVPRELIYPRWRVERILASDSAAVGDDLLSFVRRLQRAEDHAAIAYACRAGLDHLFAAGESQPSGARAAGDESKADDEDASGDASAAPATRIELVLELARAQDALGRRELALATLGDWRRKLPASDAPRLRAEEARLREVTTGADAELERLRRLVRGAARDRFDLRHTLPDGRATLRTDVHIRGSVPRGQTLCALGIDDSSVSGIRAPGWEHDSPFLTRPLAPGSDRARYSQTFSYRLEGPGHREWYDAEAFVLGETRLVYLSYPADAPPPPLPETKIDLALCRAKIPDLDELARLKSLVDELREWLRTPGVEAVEVGWQQVE